LVNIPKSYLKRYLRYNRLKRLKKRLDFSVQATYFAIKYIRYSEINVNYDDDKLKTNRLDDQKFIEGTDFIAPLTGYPKVSLQTKNKNSASFAD